MINESRLEQCCAASVIDFVVFAGVYSFVYDGAFAAIAIQGAVCRDSAIARFGLGLSSSR